MSDPAKNAVSEYDLKVRMRLERLRARAESRRAEGEGRLAGARRLADYIPFGQPILVGHHSERKHRRDIDRIDRGMRAGVAALNEADALDRRIAAAEANDTISSDDPRALDRLREKLAEEERDHAQSVAGNKAIRAAKGDVKVAGPALVALGFTKAEAIRALTHFFGDEPCGFNVRNSLARVKAVKARIADLERRAAAPEKAPEVYGDVRIVESDNRVRLFFPGKPEEKTRGELKGHGFRWAPSEGAWQRFASDDAWYWARKIARALAGVA